MFLVLEFTSRFKNYIEQQTKKTLPSLRSFGETKNVINENDLFRSKPD